MPRKKSKVVKHKLPFKRIDPIGVGVDLILVPEVDVLKDKFGVYDPNQGAIVIADGPIEKVQKTLIHEIAHHWQNELGHQVTEEFAATIEFLVFDLLKNRRELVKFLQRKRW